MPKQQSTSQSSHKVFPYPPRNMSAQVIHYPTAPQSWISAPHPPHHGIQLPPAIPLTRVAPSANSIPSQHASLARAGIWTDEDDAKLVKARNLSKGWNAIASEYFPDKTGNACRKRHERLMRKTGVLDDNRKLERLAEAYVEKRESIWKSVGDQAGVNWKDAERMCMEQGLNNLKTIGRRRQKHSPQDDSGIGASGISISDGESALTGPSRRTSTVLGFDQILRRSTPERS